MSDLIRREDAIEAIQKRADKIDSVYSAFWEGLIIAQDIVKNIPSAELERTAKVENKWHWSCDPYDESTSPTEAGYYRIIDEDGTEMTDYFFGEPRITGRGIGYWATCEKTILAWSRLEVTDERITD